MTPDQERLKRQVDETAELIEQLERAGKKVPSPVKLIVRGMQEGVDVGMSAQEAADHLARFRKEMDKECAKRFEIDSYEYIQCDISASGVRTYYKDAVNTTLNPKNDNSVISIWWHKKTFAFRCVWDEIRKGTPSGLYRKCFRDADKPTFIPPAPGPDKCLPPPETGAGLNASMFDQRTRW